MKIRETLTQPSFRQGGVNKYYSTDRELPAEETISWLPNSHSHRGTLIWTWQDQKSWATMKDHTIWCAGKKTYNGLNQKVVVDTKCMQTQNATIATLVSLSLLQGYQVFSSGVNEIKTRVLPLCLDIKCQKNPVQSCECQSSAGYREVHVSTYYDSPSRTTMAFNKQEHVSGTHLLST